MPVIKELLRKYFLFNEPNSKEDFSMGESLEEISVNDENLTGENRKESRTESEGKNIVNQDPEPGSEKKRKNSDKEGKTNLKKRTIPLKTVKEPDIKLTYSVEMEKDRKTTDTSNQDLMKNKSGESKDKGNQGKGQISRNSISNGAENQENENARENNNAESGKDNSNQTENEVYVSKNLEENLNYIKKVYSIPINSDVVLREFEIALREETVKAFAVFFDGMVDTMVINMAILEPLMLLSNLPVKGSDKDITEYILKKLLPHIQVNVTRKYSDVIKEVNYGGCGVFIDGINVAIAADTKGWEHRGVERPNNELVIRGPQEGFTERLRVNTALLRKILKDSDLIAESINIGLRSQTSCAMMYIKDIANDALVNEVRKRLKSIKTDYIVDSGELEQYIEDSSFFPMPQVIATERPDRVATLLAEGRVAIIVDGSPFVLVVPATFSTLLHSPEDMYARFPYGNFHRIIRLLAIFLSIFLPGLYIAITNYHHEMIPTDLLLAIAASREKVPFPSVLEILIMEISFELIREAGIRIPGPIGPTLGIIGALILGQAAVAANIVSPILIIIVAVTGIGSFAIPNFSSAFSFRIMRFFYIILGSLAGFLGITTGLFIHFIWLVSFNSFGIPFMTPLAPRTSKSSPGVLSRSPVWKQERRPDYLNPKDIYRQPKKSRGWVKPRFRGRNEGKGADSDEE